MSCNISTISKSHNILFHIKLTFFENTDATKKNSCPMLLDVILFDAVISKMYIQFKPGKTPEEISK